MPALPIDPGSPRPGRWRGRLHALLERAATVAVLPDDSEEERVRKAALILLVALMVPLSTLWVVTYAALGLWWSAVIPLGYQVLSAVVLAELLRTKRFRRFVTVELSLMLLLPFVLQWSLGGFRASSAVALWAFLAPMAALVFVGPGRAWWWLAGYAVLLVASTVLEFTAPDATGIPQGVAISFFLLNIGGLSLVTYLLLRYFVQERERALKALDRQHRQPTPDHAEAIADLGLAMLETATHRTLRDGDPIRLRIGIDSGPVVAGVIGQRKFSYDLWGDTVNTASRMESHGVPGHIQVTQRVRGLLADRSCSASAARSRSRARARCGPGSSSGGSRGPRRGSCPYAGPAFGGLRSLPWRPRR